jgi:pyrroloquinoline quinone biosynthesis protein D
MNSAVRWQRPIVDAASQPALSPHMKLRHDPARDNWVVLGPERILTPNEQAVEVLRLCDGKRTVAEIATILAESYDAETEAIEADIVPLLQDLVDSGVVRT